MGLFRGKPKLSPVETPEEAAATRLGAGGGEREVEVVVPAGVHGRNYPDALRVLDLEQLGAGDGSRRVDVVLVATAAGSVEVKAHGYVLGTVPENRLMVTAKAMASVPADVVRVRAKLWRSAKDRTYGVRVFLPWGLKPAGE